MTIPVILRQNWKSDDFNNSFCINYRIFEQDLQLENYLCSLEDPA